MGTFYHKRYRITLLCVGETLKCINSIYIYSLGKSNFCSNSVGKQQLSMDNIMGKSINSNCKVTNERQPPRKSERTIE